MKAPNTLVPAFNSLMRFKAFSSASTDESLLTQRRSDIGAAASSASLYGVACSGSAA